MLLTFTVMSLSQSSSFTSSGPPTTCMPTLLNSTSMRPYLAMQAATIASTSLAIDTSH